MNKLITAAMALLLPCLTLIAQNKYGEKIYPGGQPAGDVVLHEQWFEGDARQQAAVYVVDVKTPGQYYVKAITNMQKSAYQWLTVNGRATGIRLSAAANGWQACTAEIRGSATHSVPLTAGRHILRFYTTGNIPPLHDGISLSRSGSHANLDAAWQRFSARLNKWKAEIPAVNTPADKNAAALDKVLTNPKGSYDHAIDTGFTYSTFHYVTLTAGVTYTFTTYGSTKDPVLHLFDQMNVDARSWYNDDSPGNGWESSITVTIPVTNTYCLLARPYYPTQAGITNIKQNGVNILTNTPIGGLRLSTAGRTGSLNFFTTKLTGGSYPDTRIFTLSSAGGYVSGYNDDYIPDGGAWNWGLSSRIKKNYINANNSQVFVCAYSATREGVCDVYMGNGNSIFYTYDQGDKFPNIKPDDAIESAPMEGYNCIAWSGGLTNNMIWPPTELSTWAVPNNELASFDNFYANNPPRYPGAWNYTRINATLANAAIDLWKRPDAYTHASVTKPGNAHPHGYDWESKPGSLMRTFHPRNALNNPVWYGSVTDYYRHTGAYTNGRTMEVTRGFETADEAVKAGAAVYETAQLSVQAQEKLQTLLAHTGKDAGSRFGSLYESWKATWAANASHSNPGMYCMNAEFEALAAFCKANTTSVLPLVFEKYVTGDQFIGSLLLDLTRSRYIRLLQEVKDEAINNPYDAQGRYKIHSDHNNGVRYIEKILQHLNPGAAPETAPIVTVTASPNPVKDVLTVTVELKAQSSIRISAVSAHTRSSRVLQAEATLQAGAYRYYLPVKGFAGAAGDVITVQVRVNGVLQTVKVMVQ